MPGRRALRPVPRPHVLFGETLVKNDDASRRVVGGHEHRCDDEVLTWCDHAEVDQRRPQLEGLAQRAVIGLVDGSAVCVSSAAACPSAACARGARTWRAECGYRTGRVPMPRLMVGCVE
jgi:hypothetical protein